MYDGRLVVLFTCDLWSLKQWIGTSCDVTSSEPMRNVLFYFPTLTLFSRFKEGFGAFPCAKTRCSLNFTSVNFNYRSDTDFVSDVPYLHFIQCRTLRARYLKGNIFDGSERFDESSACNVVVITVSHSRGGDNLHFCIVHHESMTCAFLQLGDEICVGSLNKICFIWNIQQLD